MSYRYVGEMPCSPPTHPALRDWFETQSTQRMPNFSFTVERTVNENHPKLRFIWFVPQDASISTISVIRWVPDTVRLSVTLPEGLGFISFRPLSEKK